MHRFSKDDAKKSLCNICGNLCKLSKDHVFPKGLLSYKDGSIDNLHFFQRHTTRIMPENEGVFFRTICSKCNNYLGGSYDKALVEFTVNARKQLNEFQSLMSVGYLFPNYCITLETIISNICRGVIGHLLSARISYSGPMMEDMRHYVLDREFTLPDNFHLYAWVFTEEEYSVSVECCIFNNITMHHTMYDCYKVYPPRIFIH